MAMKCDAFRCRKRQECERMLRKFEHTIEDGKVMKVLFQYSHLNVDDEEGMRTAVQNAMPDYCKRH